MPTHEELKNRFTYHKPLERLNQAERYGDIRAEALEFAHFIVMNTPESREQSLAITKLEEAVFWSNAAISRNEIEVR